jgi:hypothetical protein
MIGFFIRIAIMPILGQSDLMTNVWAAYVFFSTGHLVGSNDPPAIFYLYSAFFSIFSPLLSQTFTHFLSANLGYSPTYVATYFRLTSPGIPLVLFIFKLPMLVVDMCSAFVFLRLFDDPARAVFAYRLWMLNPIIILISYAQGQYDVIAMGFFVVALYLLKRERWLASAIVLGISGTIKLFALFFLIPEALRSRSLNPENRRRIFLILVAGLVPAILAFASTRFVPSYYESVNAATPMDNNFDGFFGKTDYYRGQPGQPFLSGLFFFFLQSSAAFPTIQGTIYVFPIVYFGYLATMRFKDRWSYEDLLLSFTALLLLYFALESFLPQWFVFIQPLLIWFALSRSKKMYWIYPVVTFLWFLYTWYWDAAYNVAFVLPLIPKSFKTYGPLSLMNNLGFPGVSVVDTFHAIFSGLCISVSLIIMKELWYSSRILQSKKEITTDTTLESAAA